MIMKITFTYFYGRDLRDTTKYPTDLLQNAYDTLDAACYKDGQLYLTPLRRGSINALKEELQRRGVTFFSVK